MKLARFALALLAVCAGSRAEAAQRADAALLVNSSSPRYSDAAHFIRPYLDHFGIPYAVIDIATTDVGPEIAEYALIIVGHAAIDPEHRFLDPTEEANLSSAVYQGSGLVNFDYDLTPDGSTARYQFVQDVFGFGYGLPVSGSGVVFGPAAPNHYASNRHAAGETISTQLMATAALTVPPPGTTLVSVQSNGAPLLSVTSYGQGRAVQWASYEWASIQVLGPMYGLDDLVWRGMVWAARKPFVMQGMPNFLTLRVDDVSGPFWWVKIANEFKLTPWLGLFYQNITDANAADLATLVNGGAATASVHSRNGTDFFYFDHAMGQEFPDATIASFFQDATAWHSAHGVPISKVVVPHFYEIGTNTFSGLQSWGVEFVITHVNPGQPYGGAWLNEGPYRLFETGTANGSRPVAYSDYLTVPTHPELDGAFYNCVTEIRDDAGYEWYPDNDVSATIGKGTRQSRRALDGMALATLFTHEGFIRGITQDNWRAILAGVMNNLSWYNPILVPLDYACEYMRAKHESRIVSSVFDPGTQTLATDLSGFPNIPTQFYVFTESGGEIMQAALPVPAFLGSAHVTQTVGGPLARVVVTPDAMTLRPGETVRLSAQAYDAAGNAIMGLTYGWKAYAGGTIDQNGVFTAGDVGGAYTNAVSASVGGVTGYASLQVVVPIDVTIWPPSAAPVRPDHGADRPVELGVKFRSEVPGSISAVRFYKASTNTGTHVANLWTASGQLLASATFTNETTSGWQQVAFASPVPITANTVYVASYHTDVGHYAQDLNYFSTVAYDNPPLHAPAGSNGVYGYGAAGTFPANSYSGTNYWVDVVFSGGRVPTLASISVSPSEAVILAGATQQLTAIGTYSDGTTRDITGSVNWSTSSPAVVSVDGAGLATGLGGGTAIVTAEQVGILAIATVTVQPVPPTITTTSLPEARQNLAYATTLLASGGTPPLSWGLAAGTLPPGLTLSADGVISGTPSAVGTLAFTVGVVDAEAQVAYASLALSVLSADALTLWPDSTVPASIHGADSPVELGVKFRSDVSGRVSGIRFYKASGNTGTHVASLWTTSGQLLARATFTNEGPSGWQQVSFANPVPITAGTVYVASYHTNVGYYGQSVGYFATTGYDNSPLHALRNGESGGNGVYAYGSSSTFPGNSYNSANYWVDVVFSAAPVTSITVAPADPTLLSGTTQQFTATGTYSSGDVQDVTGQVAWTSSNTSVATIDAAGRATAIAEGTAQVSATLAGVTGSTTLTVQMAPLAIVTSTLPDAVQSQPYTATLQATGGSPPYSWLVSAGALPAGLALSSDGVITGTPTVPGTYDFTIRVADAASRTTFQAFNLSVVSSVGLTIWEGATPGRIDRGSDRSVELGVKFRSDWPGYITGVRFYKAGTNTGTHVGSLWTSTGQLLARATFVDETASGWQQVNFPTPVPIAANTVYVASYHTDAGHYSQDLNYFASSGVDNPPLHALRNGASGGNGVYAYGRTISFPANTYSASNYWVDVVFSAGP